MNTAENKKLGYRKYPPKLHTDFGMLWTRVKEKMEHPVTIQDLLDAQHIKLVLCEYIIRARTVPEITDDLTLYVKGLAVPLEKSLLSRERC